VSASIARQGDWWAPARCKRLGISRTILFGLRVVTFAPTGPLIVGINETMSTGGPTIVGLTRLMAMMPQGVSQYTAFTCPQNHLRAMKVYEKAAHQHL
jgi:hypothetical protein